MLENKKPLQMIWGILLFLAGVGVFIRIPQVMPQIEKIELYSSALVFIRLCFYLVGILLIGGGLKKIHFYYKKLEIDR